MRNLFEYPITPEEVTQTVERTLQTYIDSQVVGGLDGAIWHALLGVLKDPTVMDKVLESANPCLN